ncbi:MAG TPA: hypothetical protein VGP72_20195 [Planctomycetota bacterium]|jgi:hypothetical protein
MRILLVAVLSGAGLLASAAMEPPQPGQPGQAPQQASGQQQNVHGHIVAIFAPQFQGGERHLIGIVKSDDNKITRVVFGSVKDLESKQFKAGWNDDVEVAGLTGTLNDRPVVFAEHVKSGGKDFAFNRPSSFQENASFPASFHGGQKDMPAGTTEGKGGFLGEGSRNELYVNGKLTSTSEFTFDGEAQPHILAKVETSDGHNVVVDIGTKGSVGNLKLQNGELFAAAGFGGYLSGRPVLFAQYVANTVPVQRPQGWEESWQKSEQGQPTSHMQPGQPSSMQQGGMTKGQGTSVQTSQPGQSNWSKGQAGNMQDSNPSR